MKRLRVVSYNVHGCIGLDRRFAVERTAAVLSALEADVVLLQEVGDHVGRAPSATWTTLSATRCRPGPGATAMRTGHGARRAPWPRPR